ncbi:MAG: branched-chain amino acid ABC transporter permease [Halodesulfurarchaeum sp.]
MALVTGWTAFIIVVATLATIYAMLTIALNVHYGYTGLLNFGHVAFFAAGAYAAAIVSSPTPSEMTGVYYQYGFDIAMPLGLPVSLAAGALAGGLLAVVVGTTSVRLGSHYLAIATFALAGIFHDIIINEAWLTNGSFGMNNVPKPGRATLGADAWQLGYFLFAVVCLVGTYLVVQRLLDSPFGRLLKGVRESEDGARMLGKRVTTIKLKSFGLGGAIAGFAGGVYAHYLGTVVPAQFIPSVTFTVWAALLLGGAAKNHGALIGALLIIAFQESTRFITTAYNWIRAHTPTIIGDVIEAVIAPLPDGPTFIPSVRWAVIGLLIILVIRYRPQGLFGSREEIQTLGEEG